MARKLRPKRFSDVIGHKPWIEFIKNSLSNNSFLPVCVIFGPSGTGKTTIARLIAMSQCCNNKNDIEPCGECVSCSAILNDSHPEVVEFDAGMYTGADDIKLMLENIDFQTSLSDKRVYIIDEAHMLSRHAVSSLLKTFESSLNKVQFIMATTNEDKLPETIMSRAFRIPLAPLPPGMISEYIIQIANNYSYQIDRESAEMIAESSKGSVRQALSTFEQILVTYSYNVDQKAVSNFLEILTDIDLDKILKFLEHGKIEDVVQTVKNIYNPTNLLGQIIGKIREKILSSSASEKLIKIGHSLAESSLILHKSPYKNLLEIILVNAIMSA